MKYEFTSGETIYGVLNKMGAFVPINEPEIETMEGTMFITEIGEDYFKDLEASIAKTYKLGYDNIEKQTHVTEGYFWK